ncbi:MAG: transcription antitermination protein NusB [Muribaculaceae bacterium]|nr:transcription antitermination protein NusB [Muribaculaceae bacterium]
MINRSLIRIKTVQILYSYLLTRNDFKLIAAPDPSESTRDTMYSYEVYLKLISLLTKLAGRKANNRQRIGLPGMIGRALADDPIVRDAMLAHRVATAGTDAIADALVPVIYDSSLFADYKKKKEPIMAEEVQFWRVAFKSIVEKDEAVDAAFRRDKNYSRKGFEAGIELFLESVASLESDRGSYLNAKRALGESLQSAYDLYISLLALPLRLTQLQERRYDEAKHKYAPTPEDLNPPLRFVDNTFVAALAADEAFNNYLEKHPEADPAQWRRADELLGSLLDVVMASDIYKEYMATSMPDFAGDTRFWRDLLRFEIMPSVELADALEPQSVYWNDDLETMATFALKTLKRTGTSADGRIELLPRFMNDEDERFGAGLFEYVVRNQTEYRALIDRFIDTRQWDSERLPLMDVVVIMTAIAELLNYPSIPVAVTLNEYIEIANTYCSPKSGQFVNGILYSVMHLLSEEGRLLKPLPPTRK